MRERAQAQEWLRALALSARELASWEQGPERALPVLPRGLERAWLVLPQGLEREWRARELRVLRREPGRLRRPWPASWR